MPNTAHRTNIVLDESLVQEALKLSNIKTKRALINTALIEFVAKLKNQPNPNQALLALQGCKPFFDDYDYKALRVNPHLPKD